MRFYQPECTSCGAKGPLYAHLSPARQRNHVCSQTCIACGWRKAAEGLRRLCWTCHGTDVRDDYPTKFHSADDLLDDWEVLRGQGYTPRQAAERLQVTFAALDKALCRAKRNGDPRARRSVA